MQINLLPWREEVRKAKKMQFLILIGVFIVLWVFLFFIQHAYYKNLIAHQENINAFLQAELEQKKVEFSSLKKIQDKKEAMERQLHFIMDLRNQSYQAVRLLDEIARLTPSTVSLTKIVRNGKTIILAGKARENLQITQFMKSIANSSFFTQPELTEIGTKQGKTNAEKYFQLLVKQR